MHAAFMSKEWARRSRLRPGQVIKLSANNAEFWDARHMLREAGGLPESVELVLIEAARWNFNRNRIRMGTLHYPQHFRQQGGMRDRLSVDGLGERVQLLAEMLWPVYQRRTMDGWIEYFSSESKVVPKLPAASRYWDPARHAEIRAMEFLEPRAIVLQHFNDPAMSSLARRNFVELIEEVSSRGAEVVLVTVPTRVAYSENIQADPLKFEFVASVDALIDSMVGEGVYEVGCKHARSCGLRQTIFVDYGHLHRSGARAFTGMLFERIEVVREGK
jgi:hypothetical protein